MQSYVTINPAGKIHCSALLCNEFGSEFIHAELMRNKLVLMPVSCADKHGHTLQIQCHKSDPVYAKILVAVPVVRAIFKKVKATGSVRIPVEPDGKGSFVADLTKFKPWYNGMKGV